MMHPAFNQVFRRKNLVIKMLNVGGRAGVDNSFPEHNSATIRNILMILGRIIVQVSRSAPCKNDNSAYLGFLIMSLDPYFYFVFASGA